MTAPAIPAGWNISSTIITATAGSGGDTIVPISNPNMLLTNGASGPKIATWATITTSGDMTVVATGGVGTSTLGQFSAIARGNNATLQYSTHTFYEAVLSFQGSSLVLNKSISGTLTALVTVGSITLAANAWYQTTLALVGSAITITVQRMSDSFWLTSGGTFQSGAATAISTSDGSISGPGYAGWGASSATAGNKVYGDDWSLSSTPQVTPVTPLVVYYPRQYYPAWAE